MYLQTTNYRFWVQFHEENENELTHFYNIGNPEGVQPCIRIMVAPSRSGKMNIIINDLEYYKECAKEQLAQRSGTIEMLAGSLKALCKKYTDAENRIHRK
jgi:hypothetical protein